MYALIADHLLQIEAGNDFGCTGLADEFQSLSSMDSVGGLTSGFFGKWGFLRPIGRDGLATWSPAGCPAEAIVRGIPASADLLRGFEQA